jgi:hypothetical protein
MGLEVLKQSGMVVHTCNPSCTGGIDRRIVVQGQLQRKKVKPYLKNI